MSLDIKDIIDSFKNFGIQEKDLNLEFKNFCLKEKDSNVNLNFSKLNLDSKTKLDIALFDINTVEIMKNFVSSSKFTTLELETLLEYVTLDLLLKRYPFLKESNPEEIRKHIGDFIYGDTLFYHNYHDIQHRIFHFSSYVTTDSLRIFWLNLILNFVFENNIKLNENIKNNIQENINYFLNFPKKNLYFKKAVELKKFIF